MRTDLADGLDQLINLSVTRVEIRVDGRDAVSFPMGGSGESMVQLPPGDHVIAIQLTNRGALTLGMKTGASTREYRVHLPSGRMLDVPIVWEVISTKTTYETVHGQNMPKTTTIRAPVLKFPPEASAVLLSR